MAIWKTKGWAKSLQDEEQKSWGPGCRVEMEMKLVGGDMEVMAPSGLIKPVRNPSLWVRLDPGLCCPSPCGTR